MTPELVEYWRVADQVGKEGSLNPLVQTNQKHLGPLSRLIADRLDQTPERMCFLFGAGMVAPTVPGVGEIVADAERWVAAADDGDQAEPPSVPTPAPPEVGPEAYGRAMEKLLLRFSASGQRAFLQHQALRAYTGPRAGERRRRLREHRRPIPQKEWRKLVDDASNWQVPDGLRSWAELVAARPGVCSHILTTNFDPLITVALAQQGVSARGVSVAADANLWADRSFGEQPTVIHLHGDCEAGPCLHTAEQLRTKRPLVWQWLIEHLKDKDLLVTGYSGWDDIVQGALRAILHPQAEASLMWSVLEPDEDTLERAHPHLARLLRRYSPSAIAYYGIDRDQLFPALLDLVARRGTTRRTRTRSRSTPLAEAASTLCDGFGFGQSGLERAEPEFVFWPHRLRAPHLIHGVHALSAAALAKAGVRVELHLDDLGFPADDAADLYEEFTTAVEAWFAAVGAEPPHVVRYSQSFNVEDSDVQAECWRFAARINAARGVTLRDLLTAAKVIDPMSADASAESLAPGVARALDARVSGRLLRPILNYYALQNAMREHELSENSRAVITLGGSDERPMWELWRLMFPTSGCHLFVPRLDWSRQSSLWGVRSLQRAAHYHQGDLGQFLVSSLRDADRGEPLVHWLWKCGIALWQWLSADIHEPQIKIGGAPVESGEQALAALREKPGRAAEALSNAVGEWFYAEL